jgi:tyrosinase
MALRKNQNYLSADEKKQFTDAVLKLKDGGSPGNRYDQFVSMHYNNILAGHFGPAFFAWHREFLIKFEEALQTIKNDQSIALPYWDWSVNQSQDSRWPFTADFLGGNGQGAYWQVKDGPFNYDLLDGKGNHQWPLTVRTPAELYPFLVRRFGPSQQPQLSLPTGADVQAALQATPYDAKPWNVTSPSGFRTRAEGDTPFGMHNLIHLWVGGSMVPMTSPNDPVFWLHHCYIDKLWTDWQMMHQDQAKYLPDGGDPNDPTKRQKLNDPMPPWNTPNETVRPADVLSTWDHGYHYDTDGFLLAGETLYPNQTIYAPGRAGQRYYLQYYPQGVLRLWAPGVGQPLWESTDSPKPVGKCIMESRGNLVIYDTNNNKIWESKTDGNPGGHLEVSPKGFVSIYPQGSRKAIWNRPPPSKG